MLLRTTWEKELETKVDEESGQRQNVLTFPGGLDSSKKKKPNSVFSISFP